MEVCRVCLSKQASKEISELKIKKSDMNSYVDIMLFCLDIQVTEDSKITNKLCLRCYKKIINFHKFKTLALKNDSYLKSLNSGESKNAVFVSDRRDEICDVDGFVLPQVDNVQIKIEPDVKDEDTNHYESDDELLSVVKMIKYEFISEETKTEESMENDEQTKIVLEEIKVNAPIKRRGRRKLLKTKTAEKIREICEECGKLVVSLKEHALMHVPIDQRKRYKCKSDSCDRMFSTATARRRHFKIKHLGIKGHCNVCSKDVVDLKKHYLTMHDPQSLQFECAPCGRRFISRSVLEQHTTVHTKDRPHECQVCGKKFRTKVLMTLHKRQVHDKEKSHMCQFCSKSFFKKYHLQEHLRRHTKEKPFECGECGKFFPSRTGLRSHMLVHSEVKMFECAHCDSSFSKPGYLRNHMISHTKEKKHPCKYCGVKFGRSDHRKRHEFTAHEKRLRTDP